MKNCHLHREGWRLTVGEVRLPPAQQCALGAADDSRPNGSTKLLTQGAQPGTRALINFGISLTLGLLRLQVLKSSMIRSCKGTKDHLAEALACTAKVFYCICMRTWVHGGGVFRR